jgi:hypothetical protein
MWRHRVARRAEKLYRMRTGLRSRAERSHNGAGLTRCREKGLCPSVVAMQGGCDSSPYCGRVALSRRCPGLGMTVGPNLGGPFDQLATANLTSAGGKPSEAVISEPRPRGAVVWAFRQGCVCLVAGGGQCANGTGDWRTGALTRSLPDASAMASNSERVDFAPRNFGARLPPDGKFAGGGIRRSEPFRGRRESVRSLSAVTAAQEGQPAAKPKTGARRAEHSNSDITVR